MSRNTSVLLSFCFFFFFFLFMFLFFVFYNCRPPSPAVQAKMNSYFMGSNMVLAERYASLLKTLFVCLFFSAIFPQGYFVASMAMFMTYWSSKYCLFNRWKRSPPMNDSLAVSTRRYLAIALVIHVLVSLQYYAGWPFDGLCPTDEVRTVLLPLREKSTDG